MSDVGGADIERLANRMALLVSDDGEADNAGRAVGQLARRLGLSGGDLKAIVLAGAGRSYRPGSTPGLLKLEQQVDTMRQELREAQDAVRAARHDRDALVEENGAMRVAMYRQRAGARLRRLVLGLGAVGVVMVAAAVVWLVPDAAPPPRYAPLPVPGSMLVPGPMPAPRAEVPVVRVALVRGGGAAMYRNPDRTSQVVGRLAAGTRLLVQRTEWRGMMQWVEVEVEGRMGYVATTEVEIF